MPSTYTFFNVQYKDLSGNWRLYTDTPDYEQAIEYFTLPNNPVELRVDFTSDSLSSMHLSEYNVQWAVGDYIVEKTPELKYNYIVPGNKEIQVYIARSDGLVISRGNASGQQLPIRVRVKNFLGTNVKVSSTGENVSHEDIGDGEMITMHSPEAGSLTSAIQVYTQHSWQLYDETPDKYKVTLYADQAGKKITDGGITSNQSAPLKTSSYMDNKFAQFQKTWRFTSDQQGLNPVDHVQVEPVKLYARKRPDLSGYEFCESTDVGAIFAGTSGVQDVFYVDDSSAYIDPENDEQHAYRLMFQMDTTGWPDYMSTTHMDTKSIKQADDYVDTPQHYQGPFDYMLINVQPPSATKLMFTSTGISDHKISSIKFESTNIPVVMSLSDDQDNLIKHVEDVHIKDVQLITPWSWSDPRVVNFSSTPTCYIGLSSATTELTSSNFSITNNEDISDAGVRTYSSVAAVIASEQTARDVVLVGALSSSQTGFLSGTSAPFNIYSKSGEDVFFKQGEEINYGETFNSYIMQENVNQHDRLLSMFNTIFGEFDSLPSAVGKVIYEKIHNFTSNTSDLDVSNVNAMYGLATQVDHELTKYNLSYPGGVKRLVDMFSVGIRKMVGDRQKYDDDFTDEIVHYADGKFRFGRNVSTTLLSTESYMVTAGNPIVVKELYGNNMFKVTPSYIAGEPTDPHHVTAQNLHGLSSYPLSSYTNTWNWGLTFPVSNTFDDYYEFYEYISNDQFDPTKFEQSHGLINWTATSELSSSYNTLTEQTTGHDDWFSDTGVVQTSLEWQLRQGLQIIK